MKLAIIKETRDHEKRVAGTPETVKKLISLGFDVTVEKSAGSRAHYGDKLYIEAGAAIGDDAGDSLKNADVILAVQGLDKEQLSNVKKGACLISVINAHNDPKLLKAYANAGISTIAMERMPRITRAQTMDVLSSQSNMAGYKSVLDGAEYYGSAFPMMMTAAGTIAPARVMVMGAGVAGLQAIATAKRLGAIVSATDVRPATKEQVESLGGTFIMVEDDESSLAETSGGYASEMSEDYKQKQAELIASTIAKQDIVITTALIPGRPAPLLITEDMVKSMKAGSVIVDMAVEAGGNCAISKAGKVVKNHDVTIIGHVNIPSRLAKDTSALYARNLLHFINAFWDKDAGFLNLNLEDEIIQATLLTQGGSIIHPDFNEQT